MAEPAKPANPLNAIGGIAGAIGGWTLAQYAGPSLWIPGLGTLVFFLLFAKTALRPRFFRGAISVTTGHALWFIVASVLMHDWSTAGLDIVVLLIGIAWLWLRPSLGAVIFLGLVQLASLGLNAYQLSEAPFRSDIHKGLTVHCTWRLLSIACLVTGYLAMRRERAATGAAVESVAPLGMNDRQEG